MLGSRPTTYDPQHPWVRLDVAKEAGNFTGCTQLTAIIFLSVAAPGLFTSVNSIVLPSSAIVAYPPPAEKISCCRVTLITRCSC